MRSVERRVDASGICNTARQVTLRFCVRYTFFYREVEVIAEVIAYWLWNIICIFLSGFDLLL